MNKIRIAFRHLWKYRTISLINILGLTIGISACMVLYSIVAYEFNVDRDLPDRDRIYRIYSEFSGPFSGLNRGVPTGFYNYVKEKVTGVEAVTHFHGFGCNVLIPMEDGTIKELGSYQKGIVTRPDYFEVFGHYKWLYGSPEQSLNSSNQLVLTKSRAEVYFGDISIDEMIGREVVYRDSIQVTVSGIVDDVPFNSDLYFTDFLSIETFILDNQVYEQYHENGWNNIGSSSQLFVKLFPDSEPVVIENILNGLSENYEDHNKESSWTLNARAQLYSNIHFDKKTGIFDNSRSVASLRTLKTLGIIALLILVVASINFVNLETAQAGNRSREVGVRKILGSTRAGLIGQFLLETSVISFISIVLASVISAISLNSFTEFIPEGLSFSLDATTLLFLATIMISLPLISGLYPAILVSGAKPVYALKKQMANSRKSSSVFIRRVLSLFQFTFSQVLIVVTLVIGLQISFMLDKELGFRADDILYLNTPYFEKASKKEALLNEISSLAFVEKVSMHASPPVSNGISTSIMSFEKEGEKAEVDVMRKGADSTYIDFYSIELLAGNNISGLALNGYLINETLMKEMGYDNPADVVGAIINDGQNIRGVVKDFHTQSLKQPIMPLAIVPYDVKNMWTIGIKLSPYEDPNKLEEWMTTLETTWNDVYPDNPSNIQFLDETLQQFYQSEIRTARLARIATAVAIIISCLGLFGLFTFTVMQRTKEIGIRKVLGASVTQIIKVLTSNVLVLILISLVISVPIGYYFAEMWLEEFTFRIPIHPAIFIFTGLLTAVTALVTVGIKSIKAAQSDPVESLRDE